jgi:Spy/CpxP family protein refolding chaperone
MGGPGKPEAQMKRPAPTAGLAALGLTDAQKAKIAEIRKEAEKKVAEVLTPEQKARLDKAREQLQKGQPDKKPDQKKPEKK